MDRPGLFDRPPYPINLIDIVAFSGTLGSMAAQDLGTRLLHPASRSRVEPIAVEALAEIAAGLARIDRTVPFDAAHSPDSPRSIRLLGTANYDVWLVAWPPGSGQAWHDHGNSTAVFQLVSGSLVELRAPGAGERRMAAHRLDAGMPSTSRPGQCHEVWNHSDAEATSVHVYSPPLLSARAMPAEATSAPER
jgi:hypothetical protein